MKLVVVESPTKARKLTEYLGSGYTVVASVGHIRDLPTKKLGIDVDHDFELTYEVDPDKKKIVTHLQQLTKEASQIFLATDPDREGEAIAWHIVELLKESQQSGKMSGDKKKAAKNPAALPPIFRATFHEITKAAVQAALDKPGEIMLDLVNAQQARRVVDRLVGYQVSPVLWKKIRRGLSAGRVQSIALRLIAEREQEIAEFKPDEYWEVQALFDPQAKSSSQPAQVLLSEAAEKPEWLKQPPAQQFVATVTAIAGQTFKPQTQSDIKTVVQVMPEATYVVAAVDTKTRERSSLPPFTTSTLQQAAANRLGFTSKQTMTLAQQLYEEGLITYHRTDSVSLAQTAVQMARSYIAHQFGDSYVPEKPRYFATKTKNAQEAHEAIRVTDTGVKTESIPSRGAKLGDRHAKLYDLIWRRFVASQMAAAVFDQTSIEIAATAQVGSAASSVPATAKTLDFTLKTSGSVLKFPGWMALFPSQDDVLLPVVQSGQSLGYQAGCAVQKFTQPPARYNDASLVKELEKRGIGRPSTYASIISVIVDRGYVDRQEKRFTATPIGITVNTFLTQHFPVFMDYGFTAEMEEDLDRISRGEKAWKKVVKEFYQPLSKTITQVTKEAERVQIPVEETGESCPTCGSTEHGRVVIRTGKYGKFKSCSRFPDCDFTENIVEKLVGQLCPLCGQGDVIVRKTRWGKPFYGCGRYPECNWASWGKPEPGLKISAAEWAELQAKRQARKEARAAKGGGGGRWGNRGSRKEKAKSATSQKSAASKKNTSK